MSLKLIYFSYIYIYAEDIGKRQAEDIRTEVNPS